MKEQFLTISLAITIYKNGYDPAVDMLCGINYHLISLAVYSNSELDFKIKFRIGDFWGAHRSHYS